MSLCQGIKSSFLQWQLITLTVLILLLLVPQTSSLLVFRRQWISHATKGTPPTPPMLSSAAHTATQQYATRHNITYISNLFDHVRVRPFEILKKEQWLRKFALRISWKTRRLVLRLLHAADRLVPPNSCINLECLWYKALAANENNNNDDDGLEADMLPPVTRLVVHRWLSRLYPRWVHPRLQVRAAYLQQGILEHVARIREDMARGGRSSTTKIRLVSLGAGYDVRSVRLLQQGVIHAAVEFDLPFVTETKQRLLERRLCPRQPTLSSSHLPKLLGVDLNQVEDFVRKLEAVLHDSNPEEKHCWHTIFVAEGVLMYLKKGVSRQILQACATAADNETSKSSNSRTLLFADRLDNVTTDMELKEFCEELEQSAWRLVEWAPMPHMNAKHIGMARPFYNKRSTQYATQHC